MGHVNYHSVMLAHLLTYTLKTGALLSSPLRFIYISTPCVLNREFLFTYYVPTSFIAQVQILSLITPYKSALYHQHP